MYYVYDYNGWYYAKTDSFKWAKRMADACDGYVIERGAFADENVIVYDSIDQYYYF